MAAKIKMTRPELKKQRDVLSRYKRYLPMLKMKQQLLQAAVLAATRRLHEAETAVRRQEHKIIEYQAILTDPPGIAMTYLTKPLEVETSWTNIAGVKIPRMEMVIFPKALYSLFSTPPWVDSAVDDLRKLNRRRERAALIRIEINLIKKELTKIIQRINLFEKVMIPKAKEAIRTISIYLADEQTAGVGRAKIAKAKQREKAAKQLSAMSLEDSLE
ncbi:MAG: V-type ATP synthase subunit D [Acidobacteria bacterium]|nr:V-type ATP synthase subunit D [Acidobacteriota bacterium]MCG2816407.1 V-type ATP synthase subunit D [Candidatus Aminicenantes bacterium]